MSITEPGISLGQQDIGHIQRVLGIRLHVRSLSNLLAWGRTAVSSKKAMVSAWLIFQYIDVVCTWFHVCFFWWFPAGLAFLDGLMGIMCIQNVGFLFHRLHRNLPKGTSPSPCVSGICSDLTWARVFHIEFVAGVQRAYLQKPNHFVQPWSGGCFLTGTTKTSTVSRRVPPDFRTHRRSAPDRGRGVLGPAAPEPEPGLGQRARVP